jgi:formylglycine-generating enzyme required for sulfatase activity
MSKYPITQFQWEAVMGTNPSRYMGDKNRPVENISWLEAASFLQRINSHYQESYAIPNDFQWEYACRAGSLGNWCFGDNEDTLFEYAWLMDNTGIGEEPGFMTGQGIEEGFPTTTITIETSPDYTNSVYTKKPNKWGLYHMHGNVWEWLADDSPTAQGLKLIRGGSFKSVGRSMRCSKHAYYPPDQKAEDIGFRICKEAPLL